MDVTAPAKIAAACWGRGVEFLALALIVDAFTTSWRLLKDERIRLEAAGELGQAAWANS